MSNNAPKCGFQDFAALPRIVGPNRRLLAIARSGISSHRGLNAEVIFSIGLIAVRNADIERRQHGARKNLPTETRASRHNPANAACQRVSLTAETQAARPSAARDTDPAL
jgi:hypothetical protein